MMLVACVGKNHGCEVALITDIGSGVTDDGFNQAAWDGIEAYCEPHNKEYKYYVPVQEGDDQDKNIIDAMELAVKDGANIIIACGYVQATAIEKVGIKHPDVKFIFIDGWELGLSNVVSINYKEEESGYLAGYAAVRENYTKLGGTFGGGGFNPACNRFLYGYLQGIEKACKDLNKKVEVKYSFKHGENYVASDELEQQLSKWYDDGTEIIFACGGSMVYSARKAAEDTIKGKLIGVDVDQSKLSDRIVTSAIKNIKVSVEKILNLYYLEGWTSKLSNKTYIFGAEDDATGIKYQSSRFKKFPYAEYQKIYDDIKTGAIIVKNEVPEDANDLSWFKKRIDEKIVNIVRE